MRPSFLVLLLASMLSACAVFRPIDEKMTPERFPARFSLYGESAEHAAAWWKDFGSDELNGLVEDAAGTNFSVHEAYARLEQAHYAALEQGASRWPEVAASGSAAHSAGKTDKAGRTDSATWSLGLSAGYEVDLWGRLQAGRESAGLLEEASNEDLKTALMSVTGQIAENWLALISTRRQQQLFREQAALQKELLHLITIRFSLAKSTALDIYQQKQVIEQIEAALIPLGTREANLKRQLALLLGRATLADERLAADRFPVLPELPAVGLPADLLAARPDIRAAGLRLQANRWNLAAARADRLPALRLTASAAYNSNEFNSLFDNWLRNLAANLVMPVFDGERRQNEVKRVTAVADESLAAYGRTVFTAIREAEDALTEEKAQSETIASLKKQMDLSERTIREARRRYLNGNSDFLNVLREELNVLQVRQELILAEEQMLRGRVRLHEALGGTWTEGLMAELKYNQ